MSPIASTFNDDIIDKKIQIGSVVSIDIDGIDHPKWNVILDMTEGLSLNCLIQYEY